MGSTLAIPPIPISGVAHPSGAAGGVNRFQFHRAGFGAPQKDRSFYRGSPLEPEYRGGAVTDPL